MSGFIGILQGGNQNVNTWYFGEIDFIKSIAIIAVIVLHTLNSEKLFASFAPLHIWHAVPVFIMIAGINSTLSAAKKGDFHLSNEYRFKKMLKSIIVPFSALWLFEALVFSLTKKATLGKIAGSYFVGGIGPGSYFTPLYIQHLFLFPLILWVKNRFIEHNHEMLLLCFFIASLILEWLCVIAGMPEKLYEVLYVRYIFAAILGNYVVSYNFSATKVMLTAGLSLLYIFSVSYLKWTVPIIYPTWGFQHAPAFFYTVLIIALSCWSYRLLQPARVFLQIGKASYHIFLFQMLWFCTLSRIVRDIIVVEPIYLAANIVICVSAGNLFFKMQSLIYAAIESKKEVPLVT